MDKVKALFNRLTSVGTELRWRMDQREEEEPGMTTEGKNAVGEGEVEEGRAVETGRIGERKRIAQRTSQGRGLCAYTHHTTQLTHRVPRIDRGFNGKHMPSS